MSELLSRIEALAQGRARYFTGRACKYGHIAQRKTGSHACVECARISSADYYLHNKHKWPSAASKASYMRAWRSENAEAIRLTTRARYEKHQAQRIRYAREYRAAHKDELLKSTRSWRNNNRGKVRVYNQNYRNRRKLGALSPGIIEKLYALQKGKCVCCGLPLGADFHLDHIVPLIRGGTNTDDNVQLLTGPCNVRKSASDPIDYMRRKGKLL